MAGLDDAGRLGALEGALLEGRDDEVMQALVRAAATTVGTPIALLSLVAGRVQWFHSHTGLPPEIALSRATSRCSSFCQFVVRDEAPFEVADARVDPRVPQQLVERYGVRAYLGAPVRFRGQVLGSFCVMDVVPRQFTDAHRAALAEYAAQAGARLGELHPPAADAGHRRRDDLDAARERLRGVERSLLELGALARLGAGVDSLSSVEAHRALSVLRELSDSYGDVLLELRSVRRALDTLSGAEPSLAASPSVR